MRKETIIAYNTKMLNINTLFGGGVFDNLKNYEPNKRELNTLKTSFDLFQKGNYKNRIRKDKIKKIIYYTAIGKLDDEKCRSKELRKMIIRFKHKLTKDSEVKFDNKLEKHLSFILAINKEFVKQMIRDIIKKYKRKSCQ